jgi:hypothetical protein
MKCFVPILKNAGNLQSRILGKNIPAGVVPVRSFSSPVCQFIFLIFFYIKNFYIYLKKTYDELHGKSLVGGNGGIFKTKKDNFSR